VRNSSSPPPASLIITPPPEMPEPRVPLTVERLNESTRHLFERERELSLINKALSEARAGSGALISVDGEPGIGKSSLVTVARREATDAGMLVLFAAADEVTSASEFGTVVKLFTPVLDRLSASRRRSVFSGRASVTTELFDGITSVKPNDRARRTNLLANGLRCLLVNLVCRSALDPLGSSALIALDDAHLSDEASLRFFAHLGTYLEVLPVTVLVAGSWHEQDPTSASFASPADRSGSYRLHLQRLSSQASERLAQLQWPEVNPLLWKACAQAAGGNPHYLVELLMTARAEVIPGDERGARSIAHLAPESIVRSVNLRLARVTEQASALAEAVAILGDGTPLRRAASLANIGSANADRAAEALVDAHLLAESEPLRFLYPVLASAVRASISIWKSSRLHRRAAELLDAEGAAPEETATHLLRCRPSGDAIVVEALATAAASSSRRGDHHTSQRFLERAIAEPPTPERRGDLIIELALAGAATGTPDSLPLLREALALARDGPQRARLQAALAQLEYARSNLPAAAAAADASLAELDAADPLTTELLTIRLAIGDVDQGTDRAPAVSFTTIMNADVTGSEGPARLALAAAARAFAGSSAAEVYDSAQMAIAGLGADDGFHGVVTAAAVMALLFIGALDEAAAAIERIVLLIGKNGSLITRTLISHWQTELFYRQGRLDKAVVAGHLTLQECEDGRDMCRPWVLPTLCHAHIDRGETALAAELLAGWDSEGDSIADLALRVVCARVQLERGDPVGAYLQLAAIGDLADERSLPPTVLPWRTWAVVSLLQIDDRPRALELAYAQLDHARRIGAADTLGAALRMVAIATGGRPGAEIAAEAVSVLDGSSAALERAKALVDFGALLRRSGQITASRDPLRAGADLAETLGAGPLAERARHELTAAGGRRQPRRQISGTGALTPAEQQVAALAARRLTTPEIAQRLVVSTRTVDWHLRHVYQKLGIASRRQLPDSLATQIPPN